MQSWPPWYSELLRARELSLIHLHIQSRNQADSTVDQWMRECILWLLGIVHNNKMGPSGIWCRQFQAALLSQWVSECRRCGSGWVAMIFFPLLVNCLFRWSLWSHQSLNPDSHCDPLQLRKGIFLNYQTFLAPLRSLSTTPGVADGCVIWFYQQKWRVLFAQTWGPSLPSQRS